MLDPRYIAVNFGDLTYSQDYDGMVGKVFFESDKSKAINGKIYLNNMVSPLISFDCIVNKYSKNTQFLLRSVFWNIKKNYSATLLHIPLIDEYIELFLPILEPITLDQSYVSVEYRELHNSAAYAGLDCYMVMNDNPEYPIKANFELNDGNPMLRINSKNNYFAKGSIIQVVKSNCLIAQHNFPNSMHQENFGSDRLILRQNQFQIYMPRVYLNS